jgi:transposase
MTARQHPAQADIAEIDAQIAPFADAAARLNEIPGVGLFAAHTIIAGIGLDMNRFPAAGHPCSWAKPPILEESAGTKKGWNSTGHGNRYLAGCWAKQPWPPARHFPGRALPPHRPLPRQ